MSYSKILFVVLLPFQIALGQATKNDTLPSPDLLETAVVSTSRITTTLSETTRAVHIITAEEIAHAPAQSISDVLEYAVGLDVRRRGPMDVQSDVSIRGGTFEQTLILIDGVKMTDPQTGHHNMNLPITKDQIERIEILQGGGSRIFGPNAFSGAINIITKKPEKNSGTIDLVGGSFNYFGAGASATHRSAFGQTTISFRHDQSDGFRHNTDFEQTVVHVNSRLHIFKNLTTDVQYGWNSKAFGAQNFYSINYPEQFEATSTQLASLRITSKKQPALAVVLYARQHRDRFELFREGNVFYTHRSGLFIRNQTDTASFVPGVYYTGHNYHRTRVLGGEFNFSFTNRLGKMAIGGELRSEGVFSNNLGEPLTSSVPVRGERGFYTLSDHRRNGSLFIEQNISFKRFDASFGVLANHNTAFGYDWLPGIDMALIISDNAKLFGTVNKSFRLPSFTDLYYRLGGAQGSIDLQAEYSINYEAGWSYQAGKTSLDISIFRKEGRQLIDWVVLPDDPEQLLRAKNITDVNTNGFQVRGSFRPDYKGLSLLQLSYQYLVIDDDVFPFQSLYVLDFLTHKIVASVHGEISPIGLVYDLKINYQARRGGFVEAITQQPLVFPTVTLVDVRLSKHFFSERLNIYGEASNLLNRSYLDRGNIWLPGRWLRVGATIKIN